VVIYTFGVLKLDKEYNESDLRKLIPADVFGLEAGFYGGRCTHIGETDSDVLLIYDNRKDAGSRIIDTGAVKLDNIGIKFIKELCKKRKITFEHMPKKEDLIAKLEGK